ncbi:MAG: GTP-binding protein, partial [Desulfobacca sp.]|uniref:GTP-binding protein n=1 Tax=Desulfobacca sp. TaxID=2067990 RepID=UPI00404A4118
MAGKLDHLRNVALVGHSGAGKTSVAEAMLFAAKATSRLGKVDDGSSVLDFEAEEIKRHISIAAACHHFDWKKHAVHFVDTPGDDNFLAETRAALQVADSALVVVDAVDGVKVGTEKVWALAQKYNLPRLLFINKMERERADFDKAVQAVRDILKAKPVLLQLPIGREADFQGIIDLVAFKAYTFDAQGKASEREIPEHLKEEAEAQRSELLNFAAESDDALIEKFLEEGQLAPEEVLQGLRLGTLAGNFVPVLCGAATQMAGIAPLLDAINAYLPAPTDRGPVRGINPKTQAEVSLPPDPDGPFCAYVFKTVADPYAGRLTVFRIYSGTLKSDSSFYNANKEASERFGSLFLPEGKGQKTVEAAGPGVFAAVAKLKETVTGDTLCDEANP